jgi:hypothetical protein
MQFTHSLLLQLLEVAAAQLHLSSAQERITEVLCYGPACCSPLSPLPYKSIETCNL